MEVRVGDALTIDIGLEPGAVTESVTVTAETPLLQSSEASIGQLVDTKRLHELPFRITERMRFQLRAEARNALNHAMCGVPSTAPANTLFGQVNATQSLSSAAS